VRVFQHGFRQRSQEQEMEIRRPRRVALGLIAPALIFSAVTARGGAFASYGDTIATNVNLGTADSFAVLAGSTGTNTGATIINSGSTVINGNLGVWPGTAITGFPPGVLIGGTIHDSDAVAEQAQTDLTAAYVFAAGESCGTDLSGQDLGGMILTPGVYCFTSAGPSAQLTGTLTLNALGDPNGVFLFQIASTLTTASGSSVVFTNGGQGDSLFWQIGSSATIGTTTSFAGNILALTSITLDHGANIGCGRALARNGAVTMDTNDISVDTEGCETTTVSNSPEPSTGPLMLLTGVIAALWLYKFKSARSTYTNKPLISSNIKHSPAQFNKSYPQYSGTVSPGASSGNMD